MITIMREWADDSGDETPSSRERLQKMKTRLAAFLPSECQATLR